MQKWPLARARVPLCVNLREQPREQSLRREEVRRGLLSAPGAGCEGPAEEHSEGVVLIRERPPMGIGTVDSPGLEDRHIGAVARDIVLCRVEERSEQGGTHDRLPIREGVLDRDHAAHLMLGGQAQAVKEGRRGEAPADDLVQSPPDHRILCAAAQELGVGELARSSTACGERRGQPLEAVDPRDLLDQIDLAGHILAAQRGNRRKQPTIGGIGQEVERAKDLGLALAGDLHAEDLAHTCLSEHQPCELGRGRADVDRALQDTRAAELDHQLGRDRLSMQALLGLEPLLEAPRGLAAQGKRPGGAMNVRPVPGRDLEQHALRVLLHLRASATHQPGDRSRALGVLDQDHLGVESPRLTVERLDTLTFACAPHRELPAGDPVEVEGVQRLTAQEHGVVRNVDHVVDRALPRGRESCFQPGGRGGDGHVLEDPCGEARAELRALHAHLRAAHAPRRAGVIAPGSLGERGTCRRVKLAGDSVDAEAVGAVGSDLQLDHID